MKKAIINKHIDSVSNIRLNRGLFVSDDNLAKGEIIICNDANDPSIYILDTKGNVSKISGGVSSGDTPTYDVSKLWEQINANKQQIEENTSILRTEIISGNTELMKLIGRINDIIGTIESGDTISNLFTEVSGNIESNKSLIDSNKDEIESNKVLIESNKEEIDNYTINGKKISDTPVIDSDDLLISHSYSTNNSEGNLTIGDSITNALSKLEIMLKNTTLALTAAIIDLESKIGNETEYDRDGNVVKDASGLYKKYEELASKLQ